MTNKDPLWASKLPPKLNDIFTDSFYRGVAVPHFDYLLEFGSITETTDEGIPVHFSIGIARELSEL